jgi:hypothetical protein
MTPPASLHPLSRAALAREGQRARALRGRRRLRRLLWPQWRHDDDLTHGIFLPFLAGILVAESRRDPSPRFLRARGRGRSRPARSCPRQPREPRGAAVVYAAALGWTHSRWRNSWPRPSSSPSAPRGSDSPTGASVPAAQLGGRRRGRPLALREPAAAGHLRPPRALPAGPGDRRGRAGPERPRDRRLPGRQRDRARADQRRGQRGLQRRPKPHLLHGRRAVPVGAPRAPPRTGCSWSRSRPRSGSP